MLKEFKAFAVRGNVVDLAVGIVIGAAFGAVVNSFVSDVVMNLIAGIFGEPDFSDLVFGVGDGVVRYGAFLTAVVNFFLVALALFFVVKTINRLRGTQREKPTMRECPFCRTSIPRAASRCAACTSEVEPQAV